MYNNWWKTTVSCGIDDKKDKASSLGVANVGGIFVVLFVGLALAIIVAVLEFIWNARNNGYKTEHSNSIQVRKEFIIYNNITRNFKRCKLYSKFKLLMIIINQFTPHSKFSVYTNTVNVSTTSMFSYFQ